MGRNVLALFLAVALVAIASLFFIARGVKSDWDLRASSAVATAEAERVRADSLQSVAYHFQAAADSLARVATERGARVRERVEVVREVRVPDSCVSFVAPRDSVIDTLFVQVDTWRGAYEAQILSSLALTGAYEVRGTVIDSLVSVLQDRPKPRAAWIPEVRVGLWTGICSTGSPCLGVGVGLAWRVPF